MVPAANATQRGKNWPRKVKAMLTNRRSDAMLLLLMAVTLCLLLHNNRLQEELQLQLSQQATGSGRSSGQAALSDQGMPSGSSQYVFSELNVTKHAGRETLFFNRVPKVGSQTTMQLLKRLSYRNRFNFNKDYAHKVEMIRLQPFQEKRLCSLVNLFRTPAVYVKHVCFLDFAKFDMPTPIYFNMVRDPVERVISWYYYVRAPWYFVERKRNFPELELPDTQWLRKDFGQCVLSNNWECQYIQGDTRDLVGDHRRMTGFFCGMDDECAKFNSVEAMQRAKSNVERYYAVVGVLEEMNKTLAVLENYIPRFFEGATEIYHEEAKLARINSNSYKPPVAEHIKQIVRKNFTNEIEFYHFCRQRLHQQYLAIDKHRST